jgi:hypothetical protein
MTEPIRRQPPRPSSGVPLGLALVLWLAGLATAAASASWPASQSRATAASAPPALELRLPLKDGSVRFAAIGDSGTGDREQREVGAVMTAFRKLFPFAFVIMLGDNIYGSDSPRDYQRKFEEPYRALLDGGVRFYASLGNHDDRSQRFYKLFNMNGELYYTFRAPDSDVQFFALESSYMDQRQLQWIGRELAASTARWKICFFHHPIYSSGERHGSDLALRKVLEPLFLQYGVDVVFAGHEHFYERLKPQQGIQYFTNGGAAKLRKGNIRVGPMTAAGFDQDRSFMLLEIAGDELFFQAISRTGATVDSGLVPNRPDPSVTPPPVAAR